MPIGNGPDIEQFDRKAEDQQRLYDRIEKWWNGLATNYQIELLEGYNSTWNDLSCNDKLDIYYTETYLGGGGTE